MRWKRTRSITAAVAALAVLNGCIQVARPPAVSEESAARAYDEVLARSWESTGLSGTMEQPTRVVGPPLNHIEWQTSLFLCMGDKGHTSFGYAYDPPTGYSIQLDGPDELVVAGQLDFFSCLLAHSQGVGGGEVKSTPQLDYIYDYFESWLVPCLAQNGFPPRTVLTRSEFQASGGFWTPYYETDLFAAPSDRYDEIFVECGPEQPALD